MYIYVYVYIYIFIVLFTINLRELCTVIYLLLGCQCGYSALPYCRAQSVWGFGGLGKFRVYAWSNTVSNLRYATCPNHPHHFGIIFDSGADPRSKILGRDSWAILDLGSWIPVRIKNDSKMIRMIRASTGSKIH